MSQTNFLINDDLDAALPWMNLLPVAIYHCDTGGVLTFYNNAAALLWGKPLRIGEDSWHDTIAIMNPDGSPIARDQWPMMRTLREKKAVEAQEILIEREDGRRIRVVSHPRPIFNSRGELTGALNTLIHIDDTLNFASGKETPDEILAGSNKLPVKTAIGTDDQRHFKMIEEVEDYAIILLDTDGNILNWNKGAEKIKGYSESEIVGKNFRLFYLDADRKAKLPERLISQAITAGKATHEGWRRRKDGTTFWGNIVITALHDNAQNIIGFSKVTRDLTERKEAEDRLKAYARDIELQNKRLEEYAYIASHDLQEPLRKIRIFAELLADNLHDEAAARKNLEKIDASAKRMSLLIKDVLSYSQLTDSGKLFEKIDLNKVVADVIKDFELLIEQRSVGVHLDDLPTVRGIPIQLQQLFSNLLSNAIKFSGESPQIEIRCKNATTRETAELGLPIANFYRISVSDNGFGFDPKYADQVFQLFQRLNSRAEGTGIGLALSRKIVENHNGAISVDSEANKGTVFKIYLPVIN